MAEITKGYTCECGEFHRYPPYVYAHWNVPLVHTCEGCGKKYDIIYGDAKPKEDE